MLFKFLKLVPPKDKAGADKMAYLRASNQKPINQAPVVQRPDYFIRWIRHSSAPKIYFKFNVVQGIRTPPNLTVVRVCIFACTRGNTEFFAQIETVG